VRADRAGRRSWTARVTTAWAGPPPQPLQAGGGEEGGELDEEVAREFAIHGVLEGQHNMMTPVGKEVGTRMPTPCGDMTGRLCHVPVD
jgi:hypothetical protein